MTPRATIFEQAVPAIPDVADSGSVVLGVKLSSDVAGAIRGIRFYKSAENTGTRIVQPLGRRRDLPGSGHRHRRDRLGLAGGRFASPVPIAANTTYVAGYLAPNGHYSATTRASQPRSTTRRCTPSPTATSPNGVYVYSSTNTFPTSTFNATNYWVDVLFTPMIRSTVPRMPAMSNARKLVLALAIGAAMALAACGSSESYPTSARTRPANRTDYVIPSSNPRYPQPHRRDIARHPKGGDKKEGETGAHTHQSMSFRSPAARRPDPRQDLNLSPAQPRPTYIYATQGQGAITLAVERIRIAGLRSHAAAPDRARRGRARLVHTLRVDLGRGAPLEADRVLAVTGPYAIATRFAARALDRVARLG